jgi:hypothetical protein
MHFENASIESPASNYKDFSVEGFNIFALGGDHLPHLICACPNKDFARAICALLEIAKKAQNLQILDAEITSNCCLVPKILADGSLAMIASFFDDAVWKDGEEVEYDKLDLELGTLEYEFFVQQFLSTPYAKGDSGDEQ